MDVFKFLSSAESAGSPFIKLTDGDTIQLRIISKPLTGWEQFADGKPHRWPAEQSRPEGTPDSTERPRPFLCFVVYQYTEPAAVRIWQFSQQSIIKQMEMLFNGGQIHWAEFIINLRRKGSGLDTQYMINGTRVPLEPALIEFAAKVDDYVDLQALFVGDSPIIQPLPTIEIDRVESKADDLPF